MTGGRTTAGVLALAAMLAGAAGGQDGPAAGDGADERATQERLWQHRNLGKALYENPATQYEAVDELRTALELALTLAEAGETVDPVRERINLGLALLGAGREEEGVAELERAQEADPSVPHTWFNLGIAYKRASRYEEAIRQLEGMLERVPGEPITHYNLGVLYKLEGEPKKSLHHFERAAEIDPNLAGPHFQLAAAYRLADRAEDAARAMATFRELKARQSAGGSEEDLEWSWYSELYDVIEPEARPAPAAPRFEVAVLGGGVGTARQGTEAVDVTLGVSAGALDLLVWGRDGLLFFIGASDAASGFVLPPFSQEDVEAEAAPKLRAVATGDPDGDGRPDLVVATDAGLRWIANRSEPKDTRFEEVTPEDLPEAAGRAYDRIVWIDADHDYDPDLLLFGAEPAYLRNDGDGTWTDRSDRFPFVTGKAARAAAVFDLVSDSQGFDVAVAHLAETGDETGAGTGTLYRDRLGGVYEAQELSGLPAGTRELIAADLDHDGWTDLLAVGSGGVVALRNAGDHLDPGLGAVTLSDRPAAAAAIFDLDSRGAGDLVVVPEDDSEAPFLLLDRGDLRFDETALPEAAAKALRGAGAVTASDFDGDGRIDLAAVGADGETRVLRNRTETPHGHLRIALAGVKNPTIAAGSEIEVRAGALYQKKLYRGVPLVFGLGGHERADAVRITWPNGLIQNEVRAPAGISVTYEEAPRLSGSCPMIFTWNGEGFEFITDVLGTAPLGASAGDGEYFPVDHEEVIRIAGESLVPREVPGSGRAREVYEVRVTEELREVAYLDRVRLVAVDHRPELEVLVADKFVGPPFPGFRLYGVEAPRHPVAATDHRGNDVLDRLLAEDAAYPDAFDRDSSGLAELHHLDLAFDGPIAPEDEAVLVLRGWVDWADGSTFLASSQGSGPFGSPLVLPYLQAKDAAGRWVTVVEDMGLPAGKPKSIVVDLTGRLPAGATELRIVTSACVYWDEVFLGASATAPEAPAIRLAEAPQLAADLRFRGFSRPVIHPERKQPERFVYADRLPTTQWSQTPGLYTRYGEVTDLMTTVDDRFVVMGSGDELRLLFDASAVGPLPDGWRRDFLLVVDGWAKDGDANTAHSQTVGPLPFHGMPRYPYEAPHAYPDGPEHRRYVEEWLTRPALRVHPPLRPEPARTAGANADR